MKNMIWRCRCGKRVEKLNDENFGDCGCSDPVYGPEYFRMTAELADMLDEKDKDYDELCKEKESTEKQLTEAKEKIGLLQKNMRLLLCEKHLAKCRVGLFSSKHPNDEPCLVCLMDSTGRGEQ